MAHIGAGPVRESDLWPALRQYWHPVAFSEEVADRPLAVRLLDERLAVCRMGGRVTAFRDLCVHRGTPISLGWIDGETVVCAYHSWAYRVDGQCVRIPSLPPEHSIPKKACLTAYLAEERYGLVWVCLSAEPRAPIPEFPAFEDPHYRVFFRQKKLWRCSAARSMENFVDQANFAWVHEGILGDRSHSLAPEIHVERHGEELRFWFDNIPDRLHPVSHRRNYRLTRPYCLCQWKEEPGGRTEAYFYVCTPHSAKESTRYLIVARNYDLEAPEILHGPIIIKDKEAMASSKALDPLTIKRIKAMDTIADQDQAIVENQRPEELPLDLAEELHLKGPDAIAIEYRRMMKELGVD